ncbi:MAG: YdcF family protein [Nitrospirae bacterium]|nr:YdcF family protein [Nitrospirota bacterium]
MRRGRARRWLIIGAVTAGLLVVGYLSHPIYLSAVGRALIVEDELHPADAILVLGGETRQGDRVAHAVKLYKRGLAPLLVVSGTPMGFRTHEAEVMRQHAEYLGVPSGRILAVKHNADSTREEADVLVPVLQKRGAKEVILVTSNSHTARAKRIFEKAAGPVGPRFLASPVDDGYFNPNGWWTRRNDAKMFVYEAIKTVWYWAAE